MGTERKREGVHRHGFGGPASSLFEAAGLPRISTKEANDHTYELEQNPKDNWLYAAFLGFQEIGRRLDAASKRVDTFVTIGTGPGLDAIGAVEIFRPKTVILTDIHPDVLPVAEQNLAAYFDGRRNIPVPDPTYHLYEGNLAEPLREHGIAADLIYANLPNVPSSDKKDLLASQNTSSFFDSSVITAPKDTSRYLLTMQHAFLHDARSSLSEGGSVIINVGGRVPVPLLKKIFEEARYEYEELCTLLKKQSQPELILPGYRKAEEENGVEFDFYALGEMEEGMMRSLIEGISENGGSAEDIKKALQNYRVNARQAEELFLKYKTPIAHLVQVVRGIKK